MELSIPMGQRDHSKEVVKMVIECEIFNTWAKKFLEQVQKWYDKHANKTWRHVEFEIGQHVRLNI
jgi:hypothetical protein